MIVDQAGATVLSSVGWVDHGAIWSYDTATGRSERFRVSDARHVVLRAGDDGFFAVVHHWDGERLRITVHDSAAPREVLAILEVAGTRRTLDGDLAAWRRVPSVYVAYLEGVLGRDGYHVVRRSGSLVTAQRLDWFHDGPYDFGYQGVVSVVALPDSSELMFGVQRSSDLVLWDPAAPDRTRHVPLAARGGNPSPSLVDDELWVVDYDTVVRLDARSHEITGSALLQEPDASGMAMFVGRLWFTEEKVLVPRPGSGDVLVLRRSDLAVLGSVDLGRQPLSVACTADGSVVARDWKSGDLLLGDLRDVR